MQNISVIQIWGGESNSTVDDCIESVLSVYPNRTLIRLERGLTKEEYYRQSDKLRFQIARDSDVPVLYLDCDIMIDGPVRLAQIPMFTRWYGAHYDYNFFYTAGNTELFSRLYDAGENTTWKPNKFFYALNHILRDEMIHTIDGGYKHFNLRKKMIINLDTWTNQTVYLIVCGLLWLFTRM